LLGTQRARGGRKESIRSSPAHVRVAHKLKNGFNLSIVACQSTVAREAEANVAYLTVVWGRNVNSDQAKYNTHESGHARE